LIERVFQDGRTPDPRAGRAGDFPLAGGQEPVVGIKQALADS